MSRTARPYEPTTPSQALQSLHSAAQSLLEILEDHPAESLDIDIALSDLRRQLDNAIRTRLIDHRNQGIQLSRLSEASGMSPASISMLHQQHGHQLKALQSEDSSL